ncbi:MAG TPA: hypothetical protein DHW82_03015 [Spirochaetia bacterium]|nr:MAG: hypothetical protein A2Y41_03640 [Spirochaetes bacterium GWB1_36_13]HCL55962.1 hypothetical protein [Spirochaetia bacterium]
MKKIELIGLQSDLNRLTFSNIQIEFLHGYLTAVLCAPEIITPLEWLPFILGKDDAMSEFDSLEEMNQFISRIMDLNNSIASSLSDKTYYPLYSILDEAVTPETAQKWCSGFILGLNLWEPPFTSDEKASRLILPVMFLIDADFVIKKLYKNNRLENTPEKIEEMKILSLEEIPENMIKLWDYNVGAQENNIEKNCKVKIGRNDSCPCGSGKKYKHCCGK